MAKAKFQDSQPTMSSESLLRFTQEARDRVIANEILAALDQLQNFLPGTAPGLHNDVSILAARYHRLTRDQITGVVSRETAQAERAKLEADLLGLIEIIPKHIHPAMSPVAIEESRVSFEEAEPQTIFRVNVLKQISWIQRAIEVSRSVCRILTPRGVATGFLIKNNLLMTNNHVIPDLNIARDSMVEFNYEQDIRGHFLRAYRYRLDEKIFHTSPLAKLDYTIVGIKEDATLPPLNSWGYLDLNPFADPIPSEHVVIIQHPNGGLKQIAMTANQVVQVNRPFILYTTDTMPGSSGAPVFNDLWQVIAIHHAGAQTQANNHRRFTNEGVLLSAIREDASTYWPE